MTDTLPLLDLLRAALREAENALGEESLTIIPVVVTESLDKDTADRAVVEQVARHRNGVVLDASQGMPASAQPNEELAAAVRASLAVRIGTEIAPVEIDVADEGVVVAPELVAATQGESGVAEVLGLAGALFDRRIEGREIGVLTYRETVLDDLSAQAAWTFVTEQLPNIRLSTLRALIVIVQAARISSGLHCLPGPSMLFGIRDGAFVRRHGWPSDRARALASVTHPGLTVIFVGAGFSASAGLPLGDSLRNDALRAMFGQEKTIPELSGDFYQHLESNRQLREGEDDRSAFMKRLTLERVLEEQIRIWGNSPTLDAMVRQSAEAAALPPSQAVNGLCTLLRSERKIVIVTVNFDELIETHCDVERFVSRAEFEQFPEYLARYLAEPIKPPLLKIHGSVHDPASMIATISGVAGGLPAESREALLTLARERPKWIYSGYSMRDSDVTAVLGSEEFQELEEWWVSPMAALPARDFVAAHRRRNVVFMERTITQSADGYFRTITEE